MSTYKIKIRGWEKNTALLSLTKLDKKTCYVCGISKKIENFYYDKSRVDKHSYYCKDCGRERSRNNYKKNPTDKIIKTARYLRDNPSKHARYMRNYRRKKMGKDS